MLFAVLAAWAAKEIRVWRTMRSLQALSGPELSDIGLSRSMIDGAARCGRAA